MGKLTWKNIKSELRSTPARSSRIDSESFWADFRQRVAGEGQEIESHPSVPANLIWLKVAALVLLLFSLAYFMLPKSEDLLITRNKVKSIEVYASYSAMIIMEDSESEGTIIWLAELDVGEDEKEDRL